MKTRDRLYDNSLPYLQGIEEKLVRAEHPGDPDVAVGFKIPITASDTSFLLEEVYRGRSAISGIATKLYLIRWKRPDGPVLNRIGSGKDEQKWSSLRLRDLVCMTKEESVLHFEKILKGRERLEDLYDRETITRVEARMREAEEAEKDRM
jgi:hypothetical protein